MLYFRENSVLINTYVDKFKLEFPPSIGSVNSNYLTCINSHYGNWLILILFKIHSYWVVNKYLFRRCSAQVNVFREMKVKVGGDPMQLSRGAPQLAIKFRMDRPARGNCSTALLTSTFMIPLFAASFSFHF